MKLCSHIKKILLSNDDCRPAVIFMCLLVLFPFDLLTAYVQAQQPAVPVAKSRSRKNSISPERLSVPEQTEEVSQPDIPSREKENDSNDSEYLDAEVLVKLPEAEADSVLTVYQDPNSPYGLDGKKIFNPSPERAVWLSALFPGLGQIYNRRYWKLPIIVGGFMGLGYATTWNNNQYQDYTQGYRDLLDDDPNSKSYMNFFPPTTSESDLDKTWLQRVLKSRRDYYRRNRDLCIILCVGLYLLCMLDAYVDASMAHFDISPNLSMDVAPSLIGTPYSSRPAAGLTWALNF
ncbi:MAG: DUF5683 domain-containing protein [Prevotella sp.]|nr:DUF5683 domain-containing protein [Bacteroides sp.]MCM1365767.1 DUF5683 domain-containing protein [Prevotella sp.]MCM1436437.1 DUF5683 domain-containing protein [Prevotella sp.]